MRNMAHARIRNIVDSRARVLQALKDYPELNFTQIARIAGVSRMHLFRLACRFPDVESAYRFALDLKRMEASETVDETLFGVLDGRLGGYNHKHIYALSQKVMRYEYYLRRWEAKKRRTKVRIIFGNGPNKDE